MAIQGKLTKIYSFRIPVKTKEMMDEFLSAREKQELNEKFRLEIAKKIHHAIAAQQFNPIEYLGD
ncbi:MAG TPA: hypothetical protein ENH40_05265 [Nitrospirae bacterium]|nr:hypothetical protein [Nitrospirota bacterium]